MNKVILMGRLTRDPETKYSQAAEPVAVTKYSLAVNRKFKREGEPEADFLNCVAFGKTGEFAGKYFKKGMMVSIIGRLSNNNWTDSNGQKHYSIQVVVEDQYFAESKASFENKQGQTQQGKTEDFYKVEADDDTLPF